MENVAKKTSGRQKLPLVLMQNPSRRQVTFSKRRRGLFNKVNEICTLCGVEAAIIVFSPGRKAFSFGHPSVNAILNRYLPSNTEINNFENDDGQQAHEAQEEEKKRINVILANVKEHIESEKKRGDKLLEIRSAKGKEHYQWLTTVKDGNLQELKQVYEALDQLKGNILQKYQHFLEEFINANGASGSGGGANQMAMVPGASASNLFTSPNQLPMGGGFGNPSMEPTASNLLTSPNQLPMGEGFGNPSMEPTALAMNILNVDTNASVEALSSMLNPLTRDFSNPSPEINPLEVGSPNVMSVGFGNQNPSPMGVGFQNQTFGFTTSSQGGNNPFGSTQLDEITRRFQSFNFPQNNNPLMSGNIQGFQANNDPPVLGNSQGYNRPLMLGNLQGSQGNNNPPFIGNFQGFPSMPPGPSGTNAQALPPPFNFQNSFDNGSN